MLQNGRKQPSMLNMPYNAGLNCGMLSPILFQSLMPNKLFNHMNVLISEITKEVALTKAEEDLLRSAFTAKKLRKRQFLVQLGDSYRQLFFIEKGIVRAYIKGAKE